MSIEFCEPKDYDIHVAVLIIGAGATGLCAALAASTGCTPLVLEADATPYGSTGMSYGGICAAGSRLQKEAGIEDRADWLYEDILAAARQQTDPVLAELIATESGPAMDWLTDDCGIELSIEKSWSGLGHRQPRMHAPASRNGEDLISMLLNACEARGVDLLCDARVVTLLADKKHRVHGVKYQRPDGALEEVGCDALVLATCGFGGNHQMVAEHIPEIAEAEYYGHESNQGDGIQWGLELGGVAKDMGSYQALGSLAKPHNLVIPHTLMIGGGVQVNLHGKRFEDELDNISGQALDILDQPKGICYIVYDERLHQQALSTFAEYQTASEMKACKSADSITALAELIKLPAARLVSTIEQVERLKRDNLRCDFGREFSKAQQLAPPYYAIKVGAALFHTQGGLVVDNQARVVDEEGLALPNLFAGGGVARSVSGPGIWGYLPAMGLCTAVTLGKLAGSAAAKLTGEN